MVSASGFQRTPIARRVTARLLRSVYPLFGDLRRTLYAALLVDGCDVCNDNITRNVPRLGEPCTLI